MFYRTVYRGTKPPLILSRRIRTITTRFNNISVRQLGLTESELMERLKGIASKNKVYKSYIGMGYANTIVPSVILRNILESPGWYTQVSIIQSLLVLRNLKELSREKSDFHRSSSEPFT